MTRNGATKGGVIILLTDGQNNRGPPLSSLQSTIINSQVRIVTMAVGTESDPNLENFARWSNGMTYFIHDGRQKSIPQPTVVVLDIIASFIFERIFMGL